MRDYKNLGLNERLQKTDSLAVKRSFKNSLEVSSTFDTGAASVKKFDRAKIWEVGTSVADLVLGISPSVQVTAGVIHIQSDALEILPMPSNTDLYVGSVSDTSIWNSRFMGSSMSADERLTEFTISYGQLDHQNFPNRVVTNYVIGNVGTTEHAYYVFHTQLFVRTK